MRIIFLLSVFILSLHSSVCRAETFGFSGIQWTDSRDVINKKLKQTGELEGFRPRSNDHKLPFLGNMHFPRTPMLYKEIDSVNAKLKTCGMESIVAVVSDHDINKAGHSGILDAGSIGVICFFSAFDDTLVAYIVGIRNDKASVILQYLQEKYGPGKPLEEIVGVRPPINTGWHMWETSSELLFAPTEGQIDGPSTLVFVNKNNLQGTVGHCMQKQKATSGADKTKLNKLF